MSNLSETYQHIANILSFKSSNSKLEHDLGESNFDWDAIVVEGSKHLVLPAIYCRLKAKNFLHVLPEELNSYLEEITTINRNRNKAILKQIHSISQLLNDNNIEHVFLKGAALLNTDFYDDIAERMIGDIDILVNIDQLDFAFNLLENNGYFSAEQTLGNNFFEHKHLPRLKTDNHISAVELHRKLFISYKYSPLRSTNILHNKEIINDISIPNKSHLLLHNILNYQINDYGKLYKNINFRSAYDTLIILNKYDGNLKSEEKLLQNKWIKSYFRYLNIFFKNLPEPFNFSKNTNNWFYLYKLKHKNFYRLWNRLLTIYSYTVSLKHRTYTFLSNSEYRKAIWKDRKRVVNLLKARLLIKST